MNKNSLLLIIPFLLPLETNAALPIYPAEIIGRDLSIFGAGKLGHVGITSAPYIYQDAIHVHEVLYLNPVVQLNNISAFKNESPYWGSRYGISDRGDNAFIILREAYFQNYLACSTYTITANYNPSTGYYDGTGKARASYCGFYRCDTFVNYLFHVGNYTLSTYSPPGEINTPTFPVTVFYLFPKGNGDGPKAQAIQETPFISNKISINDANLKTLSELSQEEFITVVDISEKEITKDGINNILKLSKDSNLSEEKRFFLMDKLGFIATVDMIPDLIDLYSTLDDTNYTHLKNQIIPTTQNIYQRYLMLNKYSVERDLLSKFYLKILGDKLKQTEKAIAIRGFISLNYNDSILHHLNMIVSKIDETDNKLPAETIIKLKLELASLLPKFEVKFISEIVNLLQNENKAQLDSVLNTFIVARLSQLGIGSISYESKNIVSSYLSAIKFKYINRNILINDDGISMFSYGSWLEASALVNSDSLTEAGAYIAKHIEQASPIEQKNYIIGLSNSDYIKKAFRTEPVLIKFKKNNGKIYSQSVGYRSK